MAGESVWTAGLISVVCLLIEFGVTVIRGKTIVNAGILPDLRSTFLV